MALALTASLAAADVSGVRSDERLDAGWKFLRGDSPDAQKPDFADASWRTVDLPHDWSIAGPFNENNPSGEGGAFLPDGVAWYRKTFTLPADTASKRVFVEFEGVMQNSDVWINGHHLGHRPYGYVSFRHDLTGHLTTPGSPNVLAVRTDTSEQPASRWYAGSGIYRHVRLIVTDAVHTDAWATFASAHDFTEHGATVRVETTVLNESATPRQVAVEFALTAPNGEAVPGRTTAAQTIAAGGSARFVQDIPVPNPARWDVATPQLYQAVATVQAGGKTVDRDTVSFGIRDAHFESATGFWLNGRNVRLYGVCLHEDGGAFGAAVPIAVWRQWLTTLRSLGVNAIRTAHNPPAPEFLDLCDRMGFLVMDEMFDCWTVAKNPYDYHLFFSDWSLRDTRDSVRRDRNHPSIVLYSAGNEIHDTPDAALAKKILSGLVATFHENDPTRPVTQALFRPNVSHDYTDGLADLLDVIGTNYRDAELIQAWRDKPGRKIVGTEQRHDRETWLELRDHPMEAGQFLWTGVDYLGEGRRWPAIANSAGLLDRTGAVKPLGRQRQSWWSNPPMVAIARRVAPDVLSPYDPGYEPPTANFRRPQVLFADWSPRNRTPHQETVEVYSNCDTVELALNGHSLGTKPQNADASPRTWSVPYAPGTLQAIARQGDKVVARDELKTAGAPAALVLVANAPTVSPAWDDVVQIQATVVDANGVPVPTATDEIAFSVEGPGAVVAVDNSDNSSHEAFQATHRRAYQGRCVAYIRATAAMGQISVRASSRPDRRRPDSAGHRAAALDFPKRTARPSRAARFGECPATAIIARSCC